ncbi:MAG: Xaa-Pro peptidase family protein [Tannerella sp.]|jgi:Xaa-Pro aminopeptidase|nr:Xaa-Pro peptidase family protein [Tannerella sp.]
MNENMDLQEDLKDRRERVREAIRQAGADACLLSINVNIFYLTGRIFNGYCYLPVEGEPQLFVKRPNPFDEANVVYIRKPEDMATVFADGGRTFPRKLLLETDEITYNECLRLQAVFRSPETGNATSLMRRMRMIKTPLELEQMRFSAARHSATYSEIGSCFRPGMTDLAFQAEIERRMRLNGSIGFFSVYGQNMNIFMGSVLAGANAGTPSPFDFALGGDGQTPLCPIGANGTVLREGMAVMVDMAGNYSPYLTDMTRVFAVGKLPDLAYRAHRVSLEIQEAFVSTARPSVSCATLYGQALEIATNAGLKDFFMGTRQQAKFVGHGIGLHINELPVLAPRSKDELQPGMTIALEPKFVIPNTGAVGVENSFLVTDTGVEKLTLFEENIIPLTPSP